MPISFSPLSNKYRSICAEGPQPDDGLVLRFQAFDHLPGIGIIGVEFKRPAVTLQGASLVPQDEKGLSQAVEGIARLGEKLGDKQENITRLLTPSASSIPNLPVRR